MGIQIQAIKKCGYLRQLAEGAKLTTATLKETLLAAQKSVNSPTFVKGRIVVSQSGSGQSGSFQMGGTGNDWTQDNIHGLIEELLQMLEITDPVALPDDAVPAHTENLRANLAYNIMQGNVPQGVTAVQGDFTLLYLPVFGSGLKRMKRISEKLGRFTDACITAGLHVASATPLIGRVMARFEAAYTNWGRAALALDGLAGCAVRD